MSWIAGGLFPDPFSGGRGEPSVARKMQSAMGPGKSLTFGRKPQYLPAKRAFRGESPYLNRWTRGRRACFFFRQTSDREALYYDGFSSDLPSGGAKFAVRGARQHR